MQRAFRYPFHPAEAQATELSRTFGCARLVYNKALDVRAAAWRDERRRISYVETSAMLTAWKKTPELAFLSEVSCGPLQQALRHLQSAFGNYFAKRARHPRFKSRERSRASAEYTRSAFRWRDDELTLAKMAEPLAIVWSRPLPEGAEPSTVTVSQDSAERWFVSISVQTEVGRFSPGDGAVGVDVGLTALATLSTGEKVVNPKYETKDRTRPAKAQRSSSRKQKGSTNREKARRVVARAHARIADRRRDLLHKLTTRLVRENQTIVVENLEYKAAWYGREVIAIDRWFASSKICSTCGCRIEALPLSVREWTCRCGAFHDRDVNAAKNMLAAGLAVAACGDGVSPTRRQPGRQLSEPPLPG